MKGTIVILGCLFAAYAAPLFANEVPLILEETILIVDSTAYWDIMSDWNGITHWVIAKYDTVELGTDVFYQNSLMSEAEICLQDYFGTPQRLSAYFDSSGIPTFILTARRTASSSDGFCFNVYDTCSCIIKQCQSPTVIRTLITSGLSYSCSYPGGHGNSASNPSQELSTLFPSPPPPDFSVRLYGEITGDNSSSTSSGNETNASQYGTARLYLDFTSSGQDSVLFDNRFRQASLSSWTGDAYLLHSRRYKTSRWIAISPEMWEVECSVKAWRIADSTVVQYGMTYDTSFGGFGGTDSFGPVAAVFDVTNARLVGLVSWGTFGATLVNIEDASIINRLENDYQNAFPAKLLMSESSEQILANGTDNRLDIILPETGQVWGQTSALDSGYAEMKIIGRYHNETRRLVVRYGTELRIYRFGDPIYTDADDPRPELPNELTLSAYPNPFNPTTMIAFDLPKAERANLSVYDLNGRLVKSLVDEQMTAGHHELGFDGANLPSGIYFARLNAGELVKTQKLVLLK